MRKRKQFLALAFFMLGSVARTTALAESIEKADRKDIAMLLDAASGRNSAYSASLIGETRGRVFIEYETIIHASSLFSKEPKRVVYWLPRSEFTDEQLAQFRTYKDNFRVLDAFRALKPGMTQGEAAAAITSLGFERRTVTKRPAAGWAEAPESIKVPASEVERRHQKEVLVAEWWYPVENGLIGAEALHLLYGPDGRLLDHRLAK